MGLGDDIKQGAANLAGKAKEAIGDLTGNEKLENEGKAQQLEADAKGAVEDLKDQAADLGDAAKAKIEEIRRED